MLLVWTTFILVPTLLLLSAEVRGMARARLLLHRGRRRRGAHVAKGRGEAPRAVRRRVPLHLLVQRRPLPDRLENHVQYRPAGGLPRRRRHAGRCVRVCVCTAGGVDSSLR